MVATVQFSIALGSTVGGILFDQFGFQSTFCVECRNTYFLSDIDSVDLKAKNSTCIIRRLAS